MFCAISGVTPTEPVISPAGHLFEKSLVTKALKETGQCPVTKQPLSVEDLVAVQTSGAIKPRVASAASIPGMLSQFHDEWDALMLETHTLRTDLHASRQELSHALYQHDAACRVIARVVKERDEARSALASARGAAAQSAPASGKRGADVMEPEDEDTKRAKGGLPAETVEAMVAKSKLLSKQRKTRVISETLATVEEIAAFGDKPTSTPCHPTKCKGILAIVVNPEDTNVLATAGADGSVAVFDVGKGKRSSQIAAHKKRAKALAWAGDALLTGSADASIKIWRDGTCVGTVAGTHVGEVSAISTHPIKSHAATFGADGAWGFVDIALAETVSVARDDDAAAGGGFSCGSFHPDGLILAAGGNDATVRLWDVKTQKRVAEVAGHVGAVNSLCFSENGYYLATSASDGAKVWDLRKLKEVCSFASVDDTHNAVAFDASGYFLCIGSGTQLAVRSVKQDWAVVKQWETPKAIASVAFGDDAKSVYAGCVDHNLRLCE
mmetsp:Transcript_11462/g.42450  ORF Transcript_11462/g.42450 Transcript_11462/m.42450 type:complete len:496 (-) Transcript_11462:358-1845(-)